MDLKSREFTRGINNQRKQNYTLNSDIGCVSVMDLKDDSNVGTGGGGGGRRRKNLCIFTIGCLQNHDFGRGGGVEKSGGSRGGVPAWLFYEGGAFFGK